MATVAKLNVAIGAELTGLQKSLKTASANLESFGKKATEIGRTMSMTLTAPIIGGFGLAIKAASDAEETFAKFGTVFRDVSDQAEESFKTLRNEYGLSSKASKELLGNTGDLLTGFGFAQDEALRLSTEVNKLAVDLASFTNFAGGAEGASDALTKALLGERESVKALGIAILEEDVKKQMAINTAKGLTFATERQAKAQATLDIAISQSQNAIGDYARTSDGFANQLRLVQARANDLAVEFGQVLLPVAMRLLDGLKGFINVFQSMDDVTKRYTLGLLALAAASGPILLATGAFIKLGFAIKGVTLAMMANPITAFITALVSLGVVASTVGGYTMALAKAQLQQAKDMAVANGTMERSILLQNRIKDLAQELSVQGLDTNRAEQIRSELNLLGEQLALNEKMLRSVKETNTELAKTTAVAPTFKFNGDPTQMTTTGAVALAQLGAQAQQTFETVAFTASDISEAVSYETMQAMERMSKAMYDVQPIVDNFVGSFGAGMANIVLQGEKLIDVLKNIGKLLLSAVIQKAISVFLTGGLASAGEGFFGSGGGLFGGIFGKAFGVKGTDLASLGVSSSTKMINGTVRMIAEPVKITNKEITFAWKQGQTDWER